MSNIDTASTPKKSQLLTLFGGTFDPVHLGHIEMAKHVAQWLKLNQLTFLPAHIPPHKALPKVTSDHRLAMLKAATDASTLFDINASELTKDEPSYTFDTLTTLAQSNPFQKCLFVIGMDSLMSFHNWHRWQDILSLCNIIVCTRPGYSLAVNNQLIANVIEESANLNISEIADFSHGHILIAPPIEFNISSTDVRKAIAEDANWQEMVPHKVVNHINTHQLYSA